MTQIISMPTNPHNNDSVPGELPANPATDLTYPAPRGYFYENLPPSSKSNRPTLDDPTVIRSSIPTETLQTPQHLGLAIFEQYSFTADETILAPPYTSKITLSHRNKLIPIHWDSHPSLNSFNIIVQRIELFH